MTTHRDQSSMLCGRPKCVGMKSRIAGQMRTEAAGRIHIEIVGRSNFLAGYQLSRLPVRLEVVLQKSFDSETPFIGREWETGGDRASAAVSEKGLNFRAAIYFPRIEEGAVSIGLTLLTRPRIDL